MNDRNFLRTVIAGLTLAFSMGVSAQDVLTVADDKVGIGESTPLTLLHIKATTSTNTNYIRLQDATTTTWLLKTTGMEAFAFSKAGTGQNEFIVEADGDVKITGSFYSQGQQLNVPDYVFDPSYQLMPPEQLANFVAQNKHLPSVPSAAEIKEAGWINITEMQMTLLGKVEELTLYMLAQQKEIDELRSQIGMR